MQGWLGDWFQCIASQCGCAQAGALLPKQITPRGRQKTVQKGSLPWERSNPQAWDLWGAAPANTAEAQAASQSAAASGDQVEDQDDQRDHQQNVDQAAGDVKAESQKPQNQQG